MLVVLIKMNVLISVTSTSGINDNRFPKEIVGIVYQAFARKSSFKHKTDNDELS